MAINNFAENWEDIYNQYKSVVNFVAGDFDSFKQIIREYITNQCPEDYNNWASSSEVGIFSNTIAYLGENQNYRIDFSYHDLLPSTTTRMQSALDFAKILSYNSNRNICANGIVKVQSISTSQAITDIKGNNLKNMVINWNDMTNEDWREQFLTVMNAVFPTNNSFGTPVKTIIENGITTQLYEINSKMGNTATLSFTSTINTQNLQFEVVNADLDTTHKNITEKTPSSNQAFNILYRNDGTGYSSKDSGFFLFWKQGNLLKEVLNFDKKIPNNYIEVNTENINNNDVWFQEINSGTETSVNNWVKVDQNDYLVYNNLSNDERNIFKVETEQDDKILVKFSDGKFGNIPFGIYKLWYRVSQGNLNMYITPSDIQNITVSIPYKQSNTTDNNTYYLSLTFSIVDSTHIRQSVPSESVENIKENASLVYSTQNRMVTGSDYNIFPKKIGEQIKILNSVNRTYSGNSRYIDFNDPTGMYKSVDLMADDGFMYQETITNNSDISLINNTSLNIYNTNILPLFSNIPITNLYYNFYQKQSIPTNELGYWVEVYHTSSDNSFGYFVSKTTYLEIPQNVVERYLQADRYIKFQNQTNEINWAKVQSINPVVSLGYDYLVELNTVLNTNSSQKWEAKEYYYQFNTVISDDIKNNILNSLTEEKTFGLTYDAISEQWLFIDGNKIYGNNINQNWEDENGNLYLYDDTTTLINNGNIQALNWIIRVSFESTNVWKITARNTNYVFGSASELSLFFNNSIINNTTYFETDDIFKVLKINEINNTQLSVDYYWKPYQNIVFDDGYVDSQKVIVTDYNINNSAKHQFPMQFSEMINSLSASNLLYFIKNATSGTNYADTLLVNVKQIDSFWDDVSTLYSGNYFCQKCGTIFPANTELPIDVKIELGSNILVLSNGVSITGSRTFVAGNTYDFDIVCDKDLYIDTNGIYYYKDLDGNPYLDYPNQYPTNVELNLILDASARLCQWNSSFYKLIKYTTDEYYTKIGIADLIFLWKHYATKDFRIDPSSTNIIDIFAMSNVYYNNVQKWLASTRVSNFPTAPSSTDLKALFYNIEQYKMVSDEIVWHSIKYKLLFGQFADEQNRAIFKVIKQDNIVLSDNEVKQKVLNCIDDYFKDYPSGKTFYYTNLSTFVENQLSAYIKTLVPVPTYNDEKFGNLFEIKCSPDDVLLSVASMDNIQIINNFTDYNIKIGQ